MTLYQVMVVWAAMFTQGCRRLYESLIFAKPSSAQMWVGHWALGIWFYLTMGVAVWIEGIRTSSVVSFYQNSSLMNSAALQQEAFTMKHFYFNPPSLQTFIGTLLFLLASGVQHDCHAYLASLKKYTLPEHPAFMQVLCPHYLAECLIYLAISIMAAPPGQVLNRTVLCGTLFVAINLGVTADGTKQWYEQNFGKEKVASRWGMIPFLF